MVNEMADDEIEEPKPEPKDDDPVSAMLDRLDSVEGFGAPDEAPEPAPARSRRELDRLVEEILDEELDRLNERKG
jgi:hypothetical protein